MGVHTVVAGGLQFSDHLAEIFVPWQLILKEICDWPAHCETLFFILHLFFIFMNLINMQQSSMVN